MESIKKFYEALSKDEAMRKRLSGLNEKYKETKPDNDAAVADIVAFAKAEGFEFTSDDLKAYSKTEGKKLSEEELEAVAGGGCKDTPHGCYCVVGGGGTIGGKTCACVIAGTHLFDDGSFLYCEYLSGKVETVESSHSWWNPPM